MVRSVQTREWDILIHSSSCFALGLIPRCLEDEIAFDILLLVSVVPFSGRESALLGKYGALFGKCTDNGGKSGSLTQLCP